MRIVAQSTRIYEPDLIHKIRHHVSFYIATPERGINLYSSTFLHITPCSTLKANRYFGGTRQLTFNELDFVISQKIVFFLTTAVKTTNKLVVYLYMLLNYSPLSL
jgi:hypothetical protein